MIYAICFADLVEFLRRDGYTVNTTKDQDSKNHTYFFAYVSGNGITGGFCTPNNEYPYLSDKFAADNADCFSKWSDCPLVMDFPINYENLLGYLRLLGSPEGAKISGVFFAFGETPLPYDMPE